MNVAILFGGDSLEHEISILTALQTMEAIDTEKYQITPVYISKKGQWYTGKALFDKSFYKESMPLEALQKLSFFPMPTDSPSKTRGLCCLAPTYGKLQEIAIDVFLLAFHGSYGENGCIQSLFELAKVAYTGCDPKSSSIAMHKAHCKAILQEEKLPTLPWASLKKEDACQNFKKACQNVEDSLYPYTYPFFVKPCHLGSSIAIGAAKNRFDLERLLAQVFRYDHRAIIEPYVTQIMEVNIAVHGKTCSAIEIPLKEAEYLSYEDKYLKGTKGQSEGLASLERSIDPKDLAKEIKEDIRSYALRAYELLDCSGIVRFDFIYDLSSESLYFNELNPIPGSFAYYLFEALNPPVIFSDLIDNLINEAIQRQEKNLRLEADFGFKALAVR